LKGPPSIRNVPISALPGSVNIVDGDGQKETLTSVYQVEPRLMEMRNDIMGVEQRIDQAFYVDLFLAISQMQGIQPKNELELSQRNAERLLMLGPPLERIQLEGLSQVLTRLFNQSLRAGDSESGILPEPPQELQGSPLGIRYISALATAQQAVEVGAIDRMLLFTTQLAQINPNVLDKLDADETVDLYVKLVGAPPSMLKSNEEVQEIREQRAAIQQAQLEAEQASTMADAASKGSAAVKNVAEADNVGNQ
jgi:hypothetical protein